MVGHLVRLGFAATHSDKPAMAALTAAYDGAITLHRVELENAKRLADARRSLAGPPRPSERAMATSRAKLEARRKALPAVPPAKPGSAA